MQALAKLAELVDGQYRIVSQPPFSSAPRDGAHIYPHVPRERGSPARAAVRGVQPDAAAGPPRPARALRARSTSHARWSGSGSVGTRAFIALLQGRDEQDPVPPAQGSVTLRAREPPAESRYRAAGQRVVQGQRLMQSISDIFLGWSDGAAPPLLLLPAAAGHEGLGAGGGDGSRRHDLLRGDSCGWTLARAHARSGDPVALDGYLGPTADSTTRSPKFARRYAKQNQRDYDASGRRSTPAGSRRGPTCESVTRGGSVTRGWKLSRRLW